MPPDPRGRELAFVLGGGGVLGAHEVGMLRALAESGVRPDVILGTSVGAINGAFFAAALAYFSREFAALVACGGLWLATGDGRLVGTCRWQSLHWRLTRWFFGGLADAGRRTLEIDVVAELPTDAARALESDRPLIVLSRHAGPGDTIFIVDQLMSRFRRRPSVVFRESLGFDPSVDLLGHRLPHAMLDTSDRERSEETIEQITANLGPRACCCCFRREATSRPSAGAPRGGICAGAASIVRPRKRSP